MKKLLSNKKVMVLVLMLVGLAVFAGCQSNVDANGVTLPEKIISLDTPWSNAINESILSAVLVWPLAQCVNFIGKYLGGAFWGVAITTVLFNIVTLGLSVKSTVSTQRMQMIQPELQAIQDKYAGKEDDASKQRMASEMQAMYAKYNINPLGSLVMPFIQMPILIAMYYAVQRAEIVVKGSFLGCSLSTTPYQAFTTMATNWPIVALFVVMGATQFVSTQLPQKLAEKKRKQAKGYKAYADEKPAGAQGKMMIYGMLLMILFIGLRWPAAMSLYWAFSSLANVLKTLFIQWRYIDNEKV